MQLSLVSALLSMKATRDFCPSSFWGGERIGTDCLEALFREMDGFGKINSNTRNCDGHKAKQMLEKNATVQIATVGENSKQPLIFCYPFLLVELIFTKKYTF